jgi:multidrug efflux system outer membrane protein
VTSRSGIGVLAALLLAGCAVGPNYRRPPVTPPADTRGQITPVEAQSLADLTWWDVFDDPVLAGLVDEAIRANHDLAAAAARVEQARQLVGVARADLFPQIGYQGQAARGRTFVADPFPNITGNTFLGAFNMAWEIDIWGRIRRATESARAQYLGTEDFRRGVLLTLVSDVASAYFTLLDLDRELQISHETTKTFEDTVALFTRRYEGGIGTLLEVARGRAALAQAAATIPVFESRILTTENQICVLLGRNPSPIPRGRPLDAQTVPPTVPVGIPSQLLERRPDIRQAEAAVIANNADVGVTVGNFFPRLGLTALYGGQASDIENVVKKSGNVWAIAASLAGPIFQGGRLLSSYRATKAGWEESVERYQQTTINAFAEVSSTLVRHHNLKDARAQLQKQVDSLQQAVDLSLERYNEGISSYYEVLEAQQQLFPAQLALSQTTRDQLTSLADLYRALGGGWAMPVPDWTRPATATAAAPDQETQTLSR